jgi:ribosomal protein S26
MGKVFDLEEKRTQLKRAWFKKFAKVVPRKKAAQFFQIENQVNAALDLQLAASLPLIQ